MPLVAQVVSRWKADDPLYIPAIDQVRTGVGRRGLLYVGDCKLDGAGDAGPSATGGDDHLAPLALTTCRKRPSTPICNRYWAQEQALTPVDRDHPTGRRDCWKASSVPRSSPPPWASASRTWTERRLVVRSLDHAGNRHSRPAERLAQAEAALAALTTPKQGKPHSRT